MDPNAWDWRLYDWTMMVFIAVVAVGLLAMFFALRAKMAQVNKDVQTIRERREAGIGIPAPTPPQPNPLTPFVADAKERIEEIVSSLKEKIHARVSSGVRVPDTIPPAFPYQGAPRTWQP